MQSLFILQCGFVTKGWQIVTNYFTLSLPPLCRAAPEKKGVLNEDFG